MKQHIYTLGGVAGLLLMSTAVASAHVIVTPNQVGVAATQTFSLSLPSEKDGLTSTGVRLLIPSGLQQVSPTIQAGWKIDTKKDSKDNVTEIDWSGNAVPFEQRADLTFRAQAPARAGELDWKAYQTYSDGSTVAWDQAPIAGRETDDSLTPYSKTMVVNDLTSTPATPFAQKAAPMWLGILTLVVSLAGLGLSIRNRR